MTTSYTKSMIKVFEQIKDEKYEKAFQTLQKIKENSQKDLVKHTPNRTIEEALAPLPTIAMSLLLTAPQKTEIKEERPNNDLNKAYQLLKGVGYQSYVYYREVDNFFANSKIDYQWKDIVDNCEKKIYSLATSKDTESGYDEALTTLMSNSSYRSDIELRRENLVFDRLMESPSIHGCNSFLKKYSPTIVAGRDKLAIHVRDSIAYSKTTSSAASMREFLSTYKESEFSDEAEKRLAKYAYEELNHDIISYEGYVNMFRETKYGSGYAKMAQDSIYKIAFANAKIKTSIEGYISYANDYPNSPFFNQALDSIRHLLLEKYICEGATEIPAPIYFGNENIVPNNISMYQESYRNNLNSSKYHGIHRGKVSLIEEKTILPDGNEYSTTYKFSEKGLLLEEKSSRNGITKYGYGVIKGKGLYLKTITTKAGTVKCTPTFSETGQLIQIEKSNGEIEKYEYDNETTTQVIKRLFFSSKKSQTPKLVEYYENGLLVKTSNTEYEHNYRGDVSYMRKVSGESSSFDYEYSDGNWIRCSQNRNGYSIVK